MSEENNKPQTKKSDGKVVLYLGEDEGYWSDLVEGFKHFKQINFDFKRLSQRDPKKIQNFLKIIQKERPKVVFIDLAKNTEEMLHLLRAQIRMNTTYNPFIVALTAYKQGEDVITQAIMAGAQCAHVKSGEIDAVVYDAVCFAFHSALEHHGFAMAKLNDDVAAYLPAKVSVVAAEGARVESNYKLTLGESYLLHSHWTRNGMMKSKIVSASSQSSEDLYYNFQFAQELGFEFVDELNLAEDVTDEERVQLEEERDELLNDCKLKMQEWIDDHAPRSRPKPIKTLVVDKELSLYTDQPSTDSYPFVIRAQPYLKNAQAELKALRPQMIVYNFEEVDPEEVDSNPDLAFMFNESRNLQYILKVVKSIPNYDPFIVVFNCEHDTPKMQNILKYNQIVGYQTPLEPSLMVKMGELLRKKLFGDNDPFGQGVVVLEKSDPATYAEYETSVSLVACSENDMYFNSDENFPVGTVIGLRHPAKLYLTVAEAPAKPKADANYYAIIHGQGEEEKKELRKFVNSVFFRSKEAAKEKEREEIEKNKQKYLEKSKEKSEDSSGEEAGGAKKKRDIA